MRKKKLMIRLVRKKKQKRRNQNKKISYSTAAAIGILVLRRLVLKPGILSRRSLVPRQLALAIHSTRKILMALNLQALARHRVFDS